MTFNFKMNDLSQVFRLYLDGVLDVDEMEEFLEVYTELSMERRVPVCQPNRHGGFNLDQMTGSEVISNFRFRKEHLPLLMNSFGIPEELVLPGRYKVSGMTAMCIALQRLAYPNRLCDLEPIFGLSSSCMSVAVNYIITTIMEKKGHLLGDLRSNTWIDQQRLQYYAEAIHNKGAALRNCWGFVDGTARKIRQPTVGQERYYRVHKRHRAVKYQSIMAPDGIIFSLKGSYPGRAHSARIWRSSGIEGELRDLCIFPEREYFLYGDAAYGTSNLVICPYSAARREDPPAAAFNRSMSIVHQAVEWRLGKVIREFAFVDFSKNQRILLKDVESMYKAVVILSNCHTCLYGSQVNKFFMTNPPSINQYLGDS